MKMWLLVIVLCLIGMACTDQQMDREWGGESNVEILGTMGLSRELFLGNDRRNRHRSGNSLCSVKKAVSSPA